MIGFDLSGYIHKKPVKVRNSILLPLVFDAYLYFVTFSVFSTPRQNVELKSNTCPLKSYGNWVA